MPDSLYWTTVRPPLKKVLTLLMKHDLFQPFRLVGGTSLSLQLGHRMSDDIDLFTDAHYDSVDFGAIDSFLRNEFRFVSDLPPAPIGSGVSYLVGEKQKDLVKLDLYYTDSFMQPALTIAPCRLASIEEIIAMKIDILQRQARKKDFWDIHELLPSYTPAQMIALHAKRYPFGHDEDLIRKNFTDFSKADEDFTPICLRGKYRELIKLDIVQAISLSHY
jgi:hypothetical protein